jgi:cobalt-precorrin-5B (C1)-methyltransferase
MILDGVMAEFERVRNSPKKSGKSQSFPVEITISVPDGEEIAKKTFNPKLGIKGGISILGTSGIVEPMSEQALLDTIRLEINVRKSQGFRILPIVPGNYGADFLKEEFGFSVETAVHSSNFIYDSLKMAEEAGFKKILFCGHIGKLVKVAGGIKNTHSKYGDHRMEILLKIVEEFHKKGSISKNQLSSLKKDLEACISTEQAVKILDSCDESKKLRSDMMSEIARQIQKNMQDWTENKIEVEVIIFTKESGLLAKTDRTEDFLIFKERS